MTIDPPSERRRFGMHANLLYDVITKQAGTLQKAVLEGVMNGVDAGASRIDIEIDEARLVISDDGKGFTDRSEIERFFETFGTPHKDGDATYGRFRMGRGQLFAFGRNVWRTNGFRMDVDIRDKGLDYDLHTVQDLHSGCRIEVALYDAMLPSDLDAIQREIRKFVAYVSIPVVVNGKKVSEDPSASSWDVETSSAWFKLAPNKSTLDVYNLGVLVMNAPASRYGTGGVVVSKTRLDVNFARNDVQNDCPVFREIRAELRRHSNTLVRKVRVNDHQRQHLAERIMSGTVDGDEAMELPVVTDVEGAHFGLDRLTLRLHGHLTLIAAPKGDRLGIRVAQRKLAHVIAQDTLDRFGAADLRDFVRILSDALPGLFSSFEARRLAAMLPNVTLGRVEDFSTLISDSYESVEQKKLKTPERIQIKALQAGSDAIWWILNRNGVLSAEANRRTVQMGESDVAEAWTDGLLNIWIERRAVSNLKGGFSGGARLASLLLHEYLHDAPDTDTHVHDLEFYERHHNISIDSDVIGEATAAMMRMLASEARRRGKMPGRPSAIFEDLDAKIVRAGGESSGRIAVDGASDLQDAA